MSMWCDFAICNPGFNASRWIAHDIVAYLDATYCSEMLSVLVVCEWSYLSWGELVLESTNRDDFVTFEWVDLHSGPFFVDVVNYLRSLLDKEGELIDEAGRRACKERFLQAIQLEEDFFDFAYE